MEESLEVLCGVRRMRWGDGWGGGYFCGVGVDGVEGVILVVFIDI